MNAINCQAAPSPLILIVDDDPATVCLLEGLLRSRGLRTTGASSLRTAKSILRAQHPDLLLLDLHLPDGSGFDLCRSLQTRSGSPSIPIIFISAEQDTNSKVRGLQEGAVDFVSKPIYGAEVIARVSTHLRLQQAYRELSRLQSERLERLAAAQRYLSPAPESLPLARFAVEVRQVLPAGGDFYDVLPAGGFSTDYVVADASGHDLAASYWTAGLKALAGEYANGENAPLTVVEKLNRSLCRFLPASAFFTLVYARIDRDSGRLSLVSAGHPPAIVVPMQQERATVLWQESDVAGSFSDPVFAVHEQRLEPADRIYLYSDGLISRFPSLEDGVQKLADVLLESRRLPLRDAVAFVVKQMTRDAPMPDDVVLLGVER